MGWDLSFYYLEANAVDFYCHSKHGDRAQRREVTKLEPRQMHWISESPLTVVVPVAALEFWVSC